MFLTIDKEISIRTLHPDDTEELFKILERNYGRLRPWIHPSALPETYKDARIYTIECFFNSLDDPMEIFTLYDEYFQELPRYFQSERPTNEMGIWYCNKLVGVLTMSRLSDSYTAAEFGYWLTAEAEGKGIVTRCVSALMDYAIDVMKIERFVIGCAADNLRSRAVPERLGYRIHATVPNGEIVGDLIYDRVIYGLRAATWLERDKVSY